MSDSSVYFTSLGSVREVGASAHLIEIDGLRLLLDCGLHPKAEGKASLPAFDVMRRAPDACIVSHAHHDHCAGLPYLMMMYHTVVPYATRPTVRIIDRMLHNSVSVMEKIRDERGVEDYPLYNHDEVDFAVRRMYGIDFDHDFAVLPNTDLRVRFLRAGHVMGAASVYLQSKDHRLLYTSDVSTIDQELMPGMTVPDDLREVDTLIIESTYGANPTAHEVEYNQEVERFAEGVRRVIDRGGVVLVPAFALGRTQEVLNMIARLQDEGRMPFVPVYASGMGRALYEIYQAFSGELRADVEMAPLNEFESVGDVWDPKIARNLLREPSIIVATAGMMIENTPSAMIAEHLVQDPRHGIFFTGYCDPDTLGYKVRTSKKGDEFVFKTGGKPVTVVNEDIQWYQFSAHAHRQDLTKIIEQVKSKNIIYVHGDPDACQWMYENAAHDRKRYLPQIGERIELTR